MGLNPSSADADKALELYEEARAEWRVRTPASVRKAIRILEKAIALDGTFGLACAALADCYSILLDYGVMSPREGLTAARLASGRALHQAPDSAEALTAAALVRQMSLDWKAAETEFRAAIHAHPGYANARQRYALFLAYMGRGPESRMEMDAALELAPDVPAMAASSAWVEYYRGRFDEAVRAAKEAVLRHPGFSSAEVVLALGLVQAGRAADAAVILEGALGRAPDTVSLLSLLAFARASAGGRDESEELTTRLQSWAQDRYVSPYYLAVPLVGLGREEEAFLELKRGWAERIPQLAYLAREPIFRGMSSQEEFSNLLDQIGLPYTPASEGASDRFSRKQREAV